MHNLSCMILSTCWPVLTPCPYALTLCPHALTSVFSVVAIGFGALCIALSYVASFMGGVLQVSHSPGLFVLSTVLVGIAGLAQCWTSSGEDLGSNLYHGGPPL